VTMTPNSDSNSPFDMGYYRAHKLIKDAKKKWEQEALESGDRETYWAAFFVYLQEASAESACL
jgi:hypothetical protein